MLWVGLTNLLTETIRKEISLTVTVEELFDLIEKMIPYLEDAYINFDETKTTILLAEIAETIDRYSIEKESA